MFAMRVKADSLNVRRSPEIKNDNIIAALPLAHEVTVLKGVPTDRFWEVQTVLGGSTLQGFVSSAFLRQPENNKIEDLISVAVKEWLRFERGDQFEFENPQYKYIGEYWTSIGLSLDGRDRDQPWSAAFISFVTRSAGYSNFKFAAAHSTYVYDALDKRRANDLTAPFWGFDLNEHKPRLGDLVCHGRDGASITSMTSLPRGGFKSHCDIVVDVRDSEVRTLGGNVNQSISITTYPLNNGGFLRKVNGVYGILRNNNQEQQ
jgi:hypothetical protein